MGPVVVHTIDAGVTRVGKSELCLRYNVPRMLLPLRHRPAMLWLDGPGGLVRSAFEHAVKAGIVETDPARPPTVLYDAVAETAHAVGYPFCVPSDHPDPEQKAAIDRETTEETKARLLRSRGLLDATKNPIIDEGLTWALDLLVSSTPKKPPYGLADCLLPYSPWQRWFVGDCPRPDVVRKAAYYAGLNAAQWEYKCGPAERILRRVCECPQFRRRCRPTFDLAAFFNAGGVLLMDGASRGNLSRPDMSFLLGTVLMIAIQLARSGKLTRRLVIVIDEGTNTDLIDMNTARALAEIGKWGGGVELWLIVQNPLRFPQPEVGDEVFQNCARIICHKQVNPDAARFLARILGTRQLDPLKVKFTEYRTRSADDGADELDSWSYGEATDEYGRVLRKDTRRGTVYRPRRREVTDAQDRYYSFDEQQRLFEQMLMNLKVGEVLFTDGDAVTPKPVYVEQLEEPWPGLYFRRHPRLTLAAHKAEQCLTLLRQRPEYRTPPPEEPPAMPPLPPKPRKRAAGKTGGASSDDPAPSASDRFRGRSGGSS